MKFSKIAIGMMAINTVFANSLPPTPDYGLDKRVEMNNSLPPTVEGKIICKHRLIKPLEKICHIR